MNDEQVTDPEQVLNAMTAAFARKDLEAVVALFAEDATVESYQVVSVFERKEGVCRGRAEIRELIEVSGGKIQSLRAYAGWRAVGTGTCGGKPALYRAVIPD